MQERNENTFYFSFKNKTISLKKQRGSTEDHAGTTTTLSTGARNTKFEKTTALRWKFKSGSYRSSNSPSESQVFFLSLSASLCQLYPLMSLWKCQETRDDGNTTNTSRVCTCTSHPGKKPWMFSLGMTQVKRTDFAQLGVGYFTIIIDFVNHVLVSSPLDHWVHSSRKKKNLATTQNSGQFLPVLKLIPLWISVTQSWHIINLKSTHSVFYASHLHSLQLL